LNRAWFYFIRDDQKEAFECDDCIRLEISFKVFQKANKEKKVGE
jgi:hypothetical protein